MHLSRVRNDHTADKASNGLDYGVGIACCLDHEVILRRQLGGECRKDRCGGSLKPSSREVEILMIQRARQCSDVPTDSLA
jgi:hypothetical protein